MVRLQFGTLLRNNRLNQFETTLGGAPKLQIRSGTMPANCAATATGTLLCEMILPSNYMNSASGGVKTLTGTWVGTGKAAAGAGTAATYFRLLLAAGGSQACQCQGNITTVDGEGALELDNTLIVEGEPVTVTAFTLTEGNP